MKKLVTVFLLLSLCLTGFLVSCNFKEVNLGARYNATITVNKDNNGGGIANVSVFCDGNEVGKTDSDGKYVIKDLTGEHQVKVEASGYVFESNEQTVSKDASQVTFIAVESFELSGTVKSGDILIEGAKVKVAGDYPNEVLTNANGVFNIATSGNVTGITAEFKNVKFEIDNTARNKTTKNNEIVFDGYYSKSVIVQSGSTKINDAVVQVTDSTGEVYEISSGLNGEYVFTNLYGSISVEAVHSGFDESEPVSSNDIDGSITINKTFKVSGTVRSGSLNIEGAVVKVIGTDLTVTTGSDGKYEFSGLNSEMELQVTKDGYTFTGTTSFNGTNLNADFDSTYKVKVKAEVIDAPLSGVEVSSGADVLGTTDSNGELEVDLRGGAVIDFSKEGYEFSSSTLSGPQDLTKKAVFIVTIKVKQGENFITAGFEIINDGLAAVLQGNGYIVKSDSEVEITIVSDVYELVNPEIQNSFIASDAQDITFHAFENYNIAGRMQTYLGADINNVEDYSGNLILKSTYQIDGVTQPVYQRSVPVSGNYSVKSFGATTITAENYLINSDRPYLIEKERAVSGATSGVNFTLVAAKEYALHLFNEAERLSNEAVGKYVTVSGTAQNSVATQNIFGFRSRDKYGNVKTLAGNYGANILWVVNPRVACLTYIPVSATGGNPSDMFRTFRTKDNIVNTITTGGDIYGLTSLASFENVSRQDYTDSRMGYNPESITSYIVNYNTINSATVKFENNEWVIVFDFNVSEENSAVTNYQKQITYFLPMGSFGTWTSAHLTMTLNSNQYIKTLAYYEKYKAAGYDVIATPTETYHITDGETELDANLTRNGVQITDGNRTIIAH